MQSSLLYFVLPAAAICPGLGLLGWYMRCRPPRSWAEGLGLFAGGFAVTFLGTWGRSVEAGALDQFYLDGFGLFVLVMAAGVLSPVFTRSRGSRTTLLRRKPSP